MSKQEHGGIGVFISIAAAAYREGNLGEAKESTQSLLAACSSSSSRSNDHQRALFTSVALGALTKQDIDITQRAVRLMQASEPSRPAWSGWSGWRDSAC